MKKVSMVPILTGLILLILGTTLNAQLFPPDLETSPQGVRTVDFGSVALGTSEEKSLMLSNPGGDTLNVSSIEITGTNAEDFQVVTTFPFTIKGDDEEKFELKISFTPSAGGERIAKMTIHHDAWEDKTDFDLKGICTAPVFEATPMSINFGDVLFGESGTVVITIKNAGTAPLDVTEIIFDGTNVADFSVPEGTAPFALGVDETKDIEITFTPKDGGERKAEIHFISNAGTSPDIIPLIGTSPQPEFKSVPTLLKFDTVELGKSDAKLLTITNVGTALLQIDEINITGENSGDFSFQEPLPIWIDVGDSVDLIITFMPAEIGDRTATFEFVSNSPTSPDIVELAGECAPEEEVIPDLPVAMPIFEVDQPMMTFGEVEVGRSISLTATITNTGDANLDVTEILFKGENPNDWIIADGDAPFILAPGENHSLIITFTPGAQGGEIRTAQLEFVNNTDTTDTIDLSGTAKGIEPAPKPPIVVTDTMKKYNENQINGPMAFYSHMNGFHSLVGYGRMEWTATVPESKIFLQLDFHLSSTGSEYGGNPDYDATLTFIELCGRYGILDGMGLEAGLRLRFGGWDGVISAPGLEPNSEGGTSIGDMFIDVKFNPIQATDDMPYAMAALLVFKIPVGSKNDALSTGNLDLSMNLLNSYFLMDNKFGIHFMLGFTIALDSEEIYDSVLKWGFLLNAGLGASYTVMDSDMMKLAVMWQIEFYDPNLDMSIGGRMDIAVGDMHLKPELGLTLGLQRMSNVFSLHIAMAILF